MGGLHQALLGTYYMFTTLSTVGFGDLHPRSDSERVLCLMVFIFGNAIFSLILGNFINFIDTYKEFTSDHEDYQNLKRFLSTLNYYNNGKEVSTVLQVQITNHISHMWAVSKNNMIQSDADASNLSQLPDETRNKLYREFLFRTFCGLFQGKMFRIQMDGPRTDRFYCWDDPIYSGFMVNLLQMLIPRREQKGAVLFKTLEEVNEIFFIEQGSVNIGFEINRGHRFVIRLSSGGVVGGYNCTFNRKTLFVYQVCQDMEAQTLKKHEWRGLLSDPDYEVLSRSLRANQEREYLTRIKNRVTTEKARYLDSLKRRAD